MRVLLSSLAAAAMLAGSTCQVLADAQPCMRPAEKAAFDIAGLKSELMVVAIDCQAQSKFNAFVARFRPDLVNSENGLNAYFRRTAKGGVDRAHDDYITSLANAQSDGAVARGTLFCGERVGMFDTVLGLKDGNELRAYASGQGIAQPISVTECPASPPAKKIKTASAKPE
jgi:hypothetical protein